MTSKLLFIASILFAAFTCSSQQIINLYKTVPNSIHSDVVNEKSDTTANNRIRISAITQPTLTAFFPEKGKSNGTAVIICPGGGYSYLVLNKEGTEVAEAFAKKGLAAFVLKYSLPNDKIIKDKFIVPLQDAQQAIKTVRERANELNIDTSRVGIMLFSASLQLAAASSTHFNDLIINNKDNSNLRPDFSILVY